MPQRVSVTAPSGRDGEIIANILTTAGIEVFIEPDLDAVISAIRDERVGVLVIAEEAFRSGALDRLSKRLSAQDPWSDMPIIFLSLPRSSNDVPALVIEKLGNVTLLERPLRSLVLLTAVKAALRDRARQHEVAAQISKIRAQGDEVAASKRDLEVLNAQLEDRVATALAERKVLADIVEGTDSFVQVADMNFRWLAINRASSEEFERIFGRRPEVGASMLDTLADFPAHRADVEAVWSRALAGEEFIEVAEFGEPDRDRRTYEMKFNTLRDPDGRQIGAYQFVTDVTDRVAKEQQLADANATVQQMAKLETLGQLTGGVAHDFNNLLTPIVGGLDLLRRRHADDAKTARIVAGASEAADRATRLVQRLLAFARRQTLQSRVVDIRELVLGLKDLLTRTLGPEIDLRLQVPARPVFAKVDPGQLEMALLNLAVNSRDAMNGRGVIRISLALRTIRGGEISDLLGGEYLALAVSDSGGGMDPGLLAKAIEPFFTTKAVGQGTGLGLSMVHGLAAQFGGTLRLLNDFGNGLAAEILLPEADSDEFRAENKPERRSTSDVKSMRILLVDDDPLTREAVAMLLEDMGHDVISVESAKLALSLMETRDVDFVIADVLMPEIRGDELAGVIARNHRTPVLLLTGHPGELNEDAKLHPLLFKPVDKARLREALSQTISATA